MSNLGGYLNSLSDDVKEIDLSHKKLNVLPDLSRFKKLKTLYCSYNELTSLPENLPNSLEKLDCSYNELTSLPENLPTSLEYLWCDNNNLTSLPENLPKFLEYLLCYNNNLMLLPENLPNSLELLYCRNNNLTSLPENLPTSLKILWCYSDSLLKIYPKLQQYENNLEYIKQRNEEFVQERIIERTQIIKPEIEELWIKKQWHPDMIF